MNNHSISRWQQRKATRSASSRPAAIVAAMMVCWGCLSQSSLAQPAMPATNAMRTAAAVAQDEQFSFIMFYQTLDERAQTMQRVLTSTLGDRADVKILPVQINDPSKAELIQRFDATRIPMPAVAVLAPNGAICKVLPRSVTSEYLLACIVSKGQAECLKALQSQKIVALCVQPTPSTDTPVGVRQFLSDPLYRDRTSLVTVSGNDSRESTFLGQLRVPTDRNTPVIALMAPPGILVGIFDHSVTYNELNDKLVSAGKCCDDPNCKHRRNASTSPATRR